MAPRRGFVITAAGVVAAAITITVAAVMVVRSEQDDGDADVAPTTPSGGPVFETPTNTVLLLSDGIDGVTALDLDTGIAGRRVIEGERAGDQPYRINLTGDHLVVGWGEIYAAPLDGGPSRLIDEATIFIPAAEPGEVWTVDYPGGRIGQGRAEIRRVTTDGTIVASSSALDTSRHHPLYGVPGGLAVRGPEGLAVWDAATGLVGDAIAAGARIGTIVSDGRHLASCAAPCAEPRVVDLERTGPPTAPAGVAGRGLALSPVGTHVAVLQTIPGGRIELVVTDLTTGGETRVATTPLPPVGTLQWTDDGRQLFYATYSYGAAKTTLGRYDLASAAWQSVEVDIGDSVTFIAVARDRARALLTGHRVEPDECPSADGVFPSGRTDACTFLVGSRPWPDGRERSGGPDTVGP
ncbi:MAG: hypothetical protein ACRD07_10155 [Acidimicrobiales bacterium]